MDAKKADNYKQEQKILFNSCLALIISVYLLILFLTAPEHLNDDSIISYRYVWNLVRGFGLVNYLGAPHVEGYSNALFVFLVSPY